MLHEIQALEINITKITENSVEKNFKIEEINTKERVTFQNEGIKLT